MEGLHGVSSGRLRSVPLGKVILVLTFGVVVAIFCGTSFLLWDLRQREVAHARGEIVSLSRILAEQTSRAFEGVDLVLHSVQDRLDAGIGQKLDLGDPMVFFLLRSRTSSLPQLSSVFVTNPVGKVMNASHDNMVRGHSVAERTYFSFWKGEGAQGLYVSPPMRSQLDGKWSLYLSRRLSGPNGELRGVVVARVDLDYFQSLYRSISLDNIRPIFLMSRDGALVVAQPPDASAVGSRIGHAGRVRMLAQEAGLQLIEEQGVRTVAYRPVSNFPLSVGVAIGRHESLAPWRSIAWPVSVSALLVALAIALAGWRLSREAERERALLRALRGSNQQLRDLSEAIQHVREDERTRIARELHDELGQKLTGLKFEISWLSGRLKKTQPDLADKVEEMKNLLGDTIEETRRISSELRPLMLDDLGFAAAAEWTVQAFVKRTSIPVKLELPGVDCVKGDPLATNLFRILQESLTNVMRHAEATAVSVRLLQQNDQIVLRVEDNGCGLPEAGVNKAGGFGLLGIRERVRALGGTLVLERAEGGGLVIEARIPFAAKDEEAYDV